MLEILILAVLLLGLGRSSPPTGGTRGPATLARQRMERAAEVADAAEAAPVPVAHSYLVRHRFCALDARLW